jgi:sortase A
MTHALIPTTRPRGRGLTLLSELLILAGFVIGLFVVWQSFWTDVTAANSQHHLLAALHQSAPAAERRSPGPEHVGSAPVLPEPSRQAAVFASLQVPRFGAGYDQPIGEGTDRFTVLNTVGLGHYNGSAMPGAAGNFAVAGHRVTYGKPLNQIADLRVGDPLVVRVTDPAKHFDVWYVYRVTGHEIVLPTQTDVIAAVPDRPGATPDATQRSMTLTSCNPKWSSAQRYIVHATLAYWMPAAAGTPAELTGRNG